MILNGDGKTDNGSLSRNYFSFSSFGILFEMGGR